MKWTRAYSVRTTAGYHSASAEDVEKHGKDVATWMMDNSKKRVICATCLWTPGNVITILYCEEDE